MDYSSGYEEYDSDLPKRTDSTYKKIEKFEQYELTHCVVYEMARRNEKVKKIINELDSVMSLQNKRYAEKKVKITPERNKKYRDLQLKYQDLEHELRFTYFIYYEQDKVHIPVLDNPFKKDVSAMGADEFLEHISSTMNSPFMIHMSNKVGEFLSDDGEISNYKSDDYKDDGFIVSKGIDTGDRILNISSINTDFKRKVHDTNLINIVLNTSLPEKDLVAYIRHIKKNSKKIKSPDSLLGKDTRKIKKISNYPTNNTATKMADFFFIYDYVTERKSIDNEVKNHAIFNDVEAHIQIAYYLEKSDKDSLDMENSTDSIFHDLVFPPYRSTFKIAQIKYKKETIHNKINELCDDLSAFLDSAEKAIIQKKHSKKIEKSRENRIFDTIEFMLHSKYIDELNKKYSYIKSSERKKIFDSIESLLEEYKVSGSALLNHYKVMKEYIEGDKPRYPELLTGESVIETPEEDEAASDEDK